MDAKQKIFSFTLKFGTAGGTIIHMSKADKRLLKLKNNPMD
jgi:hypothetical protein